MACEHLAAIILAAGYSSRMSDFKPLLRLGQSTVIETAVAIFRKAEVQDITVVVGHKADELIPLLKKLDVKFVLNPDYKDGMYTSIIKGVGSLSSDVKGFFLLPADIPLVRSSTVEALLAAYQKLGPRIFYPTFQKERGHPPLIPAAIFSDILSSDGRGGLQSLLECYEASAADVEVQDEGILLDMDTPAEYEKICKMFGMCKER